MSLRVTVVSTLLLCVFTAASGQSSTARFLLFPPSAVSAGMGGAGVALDASPFSSFFNTAGLAFAPTMSVGGSYVKPLPTFRNVEHSYFAAAVRMDDLGTIAVSANLYWKGKHPRTYIGVYSIDDELLDWQAKLSFARNFSDDIAGGIGFGIVHLELAEYGVLSEGGTSSSTSVMFDGGLCIRNQIRTATYIDDKADPHAHTGMSIGIVLANLGPKVTMTKGGRPDPLPARIVAGVAYSPVRTYPAGLMVTVDAEKQLSEGSVIDHLHWGGELLLFELVALRGGYSQDTWGPKTSFWTWGAGLRLRSLHVNVAHYTRALLPSWHVDGILSVDLP